MNHSRKIEARDMQTKPNGKLDAWQWGATAARLAATELLLREAKDAAHALGKDPTNEQTENVARETLAKAVRWLNEIAAEIAAAERR